MENPTISALHMPSSLTSLFILLFGFNYDASHFLNVIHSFTFKTFEIYFRVLEKTLALQLFLYLILYSLMIHINDNDYLRNRLAF